MDIGVPDIDDAELIGSGAFGMVYRARQEAFDRTVAVKVLANVALDETALTRFARETRAIGRLSGHPNIVSVFAHGLTARGQPFLVMEYCEGGSHGDALERGQSYPWELATEVGLAIAGALATAHRVGILHRDIKPDNLLVDAYRTSKLADFGIARSEQQASMTGTGALTGSPAFMAPEIIEGERPSASSDLYSLASTIHTLIAGAPPFVRDTDGSVLALLRRISCETAPHLGSLGVPGPVADLLHRTLAKSPLERPPDCETFARELQAARRDLGIPPGAYRVLGPLEQSTSPVGSPDPAGGEETLVGARRPPAPASSTPLPEPAPEHSAGASTPRSPAPPDRDAAGFGRASSVRRTLVPLVAAVTALLLVGGGWWLFLTLDRSQPTVPVVDEVTTTPSATAAPPAIPGPEAATALVLDEDQMSQLSTGRWVGVDGGLGIDPGQGFCNQLLDQGPTHLNQRQYTDQSQTGRSQLSSIDAAGAVFDSEQAASTYLREREESAGCAVWDDRGVLMRVVQLSADPTSVTCGCQSISVHRTGPDRPTAGTSQVYSVLIQQGRYLVMVFYSPQGSAAQDPESMLAELTDVAARHLDEVATRG